MLLKYQICLHTNFYLGFVLYFSNYHFFWSYKQSQFLFTLEIFTLTSSSTIALKCSNMYSVSVIADNSKPWWIFMVQSCWNNRLTYCHSLDSSFQTASHILWIHTLINIISLLSQHWWQNMKRLKFHKFRLNTSRFRLLFEYSFLSKESCVYLFRYSMWYFDF